jgi:hypothetical protein
MAESLLGQRVRCLGCDILFTALAEPELAPLPSHAPREEAPPSPRPLPQPVARPAFRRGPASGRQAHCPGCQRRVGWEALRCPYCGEEFEAERPGDTRHLGREFSRRDQEAHRGPLIANMGQVSLVVGALSLCLFGLGAIVSIPLGAVAWILATNDLERMRTGQMDPMGKGQTELGRTYGITGIVLSAVFGLFWVAYLLEHWL